MGRGHREASKTVLFSQIPWIYRLLSIIAQSFLTPINVTSWQVVETLGNAPPFCYNPGEEEQSVCIHSWAVLPNCILPPAVATFQPGQTVEV